MDGGLTGDKWQMGSIWTDGEVSAPSREDWVANGHVDLTRGSHVGDVVGCIMHPYYNSVPCNAEIPEAAPEGGPCSPCHPKTKDPSIILLF